MKRYGMVVLMGLTLTACNKTPDSFTIGSVDGANLNEVQDGSTIRSTANHTWKLKVGQQIQFTKPYAFSKMYLEDLSNRNVCTPRDCSSSTTALYRMDDWNEKVEINESVGVIIGRYVGKAEVCLRRWDSKLSDHTHTYCSTFEVVQ
jgi:hypothetical protein